MSVVQMMWGTVQQAGEKNKKKISGNHWTWADKRKKTKKKWRHFKRSLWQNQAYDICIIEVPEGKER